MDRGLARPGPKGLTCREIVVNEYHASRPVKVKAFHDQPVGRAIVAVAKMKSNFWLVFDMNSSELCLSKQRVPLRERELGGMLKAIFLPKLSGSHHRHRERQRW